MVRVAKTGNEAMAEAMRQINPDVVPVYPITPATEIAQIFAGFVADGKVDSEMVRVESEHSAISAAFGASAAGARAMTATSSQGLALMWEILPICSAVRLPIIMAEVNRAISGPINIHCDHSDTMGARDVGWIQIFSENAQEAYDNMLQAVKISEHDDVRLPSMVTTDGFIISHAMEAVDMLDDKDAKEYVGNFVADHPLLDTTKPGTIGAIDLQNYYFEHKYPVAMAMKAAINVIVETGKSYGEKTGRHYGLFEEVAMDDAELVLVILGSTAGTNRTAIEQLRAEGIKAGMIKLRVFRPFPFEELAKALGNAKVVGVLDRSDSYNAFGGPLFTEICAALFNSDKRPKVKNYIYGLGGRDINVKDLKDIYMELNSVKETGTIKELVTYKGVRI
ncbi:MAG: pyruvate ferredoxin oxidoreductase [Candidatus Margulisiibacteriota bacterium]|nr:MAG: pyruvate ferredoxin oxidoreductase [Candidatus Margulisbacteria bacterium GWD2_39_127]OGI05429.1 MAG: pyruvate ferredoxin oxidoreductase [Candidatus Margulisbacteria bacterium GWF2_38_17]OGI07833.1 MAG: pyruvate ferredoxin oxidoreductase [Candidatus Margulisbacteria bacterium GWE2_39_32]PZM80111.1 MAG: pyruvate ferredoxin oxidoreductase [Candidatus Margulisiibacteriota bacterium]HAR62624.1 pyruvate ferredoxin oxidoreductase [Candidatus Margulisiibacteriota bacterium]